jgi:cytochrome c oxidase subunit 2
MVLAIVLILLVAGSILFHFLSPWWFTPLASNWSAVDDTVTVTFWVTGIVFIAVNLFMAYAIIRYRHRKGNVAHYEPENKKLEGWLTGITTVGVAAMLAPGLFVWADFVTVPDNAAELEVVGQQWQWSFRFPGKDGVMGKTDAGRISVENPFGLNPDDPNGQDDILIADNEVHLPINKPVKTLLRSKDVLHNFAVPQFRVKMDLVPGMVTSLWFTPTRTGTYEILCEELCGLAHHTMRGRVVVDEEDVFRDWLDKQPTFAEVSAQEPADVATGQALYGVCSACHGGQGEGNPALNAPKLSGQHSWYTVRQLNYYKQRIRGTHEQDIYGKQMAPMAMTLPDEKAVRNVAAYIATLPDTEVVATIAGDIRKGQSIYATCGACHGRQGQGSFGTGSPKLSGQQDWYLSRQLDNYKQGIRGAHPQDSLGTQMASMADTLKNDQAVNDVIAYINTLQKEGSE